ncbi:MAG: DUF1566 domain-containing protein [Leptospira sp.]|nr:DUF1566 domain-containing protein [Leptospira sp.]
MRTWNGRKFAIGVTVAFLFSQCSLPKIDDSLLIYDVYFRILRSSQPQTATGQQTNNPVQTNSDQSGASQEVGRAISGNVVGLLSIGLRLRNSDGKETILNPGQTNFSIQNTQLGTYSVTIQRQALGQRCVLTNPAGDSQVNVTDITVTCSGIGEAGMGLWDTGVTQCYANTNSSAGVCPNAAFPGQDGVSAPTMARSFTVRGDGNIKDNVTGLIWRPCIVGYSGANCSVGIATTSNFATAQTKCGALPWRVPTPKELMSIIDFMNPGYGINSNFPNHPGGFYLWSNLDMGIIFAHGLSIDTGRIELVNTGSTILGHVQCVNDSEVVSVTENFTDLGNGIIRDEVNGLEWEKCIEGLSGANCNVGTYSSQFWQNRLTYCDNLTLGGFSDWRMPDIYELTSLVDFTRFALATTLNPIFVGSPREVYHSSTTTGNGNFHSGSHYNSVGNAPFITGSFAASNEKNQSHPTRCVRGPIVR